MPLAERLDAAVAKRLFFPLIVTVARFARISQYEFAAYAAVGGFLCLVPMVADSQLPVGALTRYAVLAFIAFGVAVLALKPHLLARTNGFLRAAIWIMFAENLSLSILVHLRPAPLALWSLQLFSHYALMIDTIPPAPRGNRESKTGGSHFSAAERSDRQAAVRAIGADHRMMSR